MERMKLAVNKLRDAGHGTASQAGLQRRGPLHPSEPGLKKEIPALDHCSEGVTAERPDLPKSGDGAYHRGAAAQGTLLIVLTGRLACLDSACSHRMP